MLKLYCFQRILNLQEIKMIFGQNKIKLTLEISNFVLEETTLILQGKLVTAKQFPN